MILPIETQFSPNYLVEKIWQGLESTVSDEQIDEYFYSQKIWKGYAFDLMYKCFPKIHHITDLEAQEGDALVLVAKDTGFQFAPELSVVSTQTIDIFWGQTQEYQKNQFQTPVTVTIDGNLTFECLWDPTEKTILEGNPSLSELATNEGFQEDVPIVAFLKHYSENFRGNIVHWTKFRY